MMQLWVKCLSPDGR